MSHRTIQGSGKTLAYGLPILHHLLTQASSQTKSARSKQKRPLRALILAPTRELALQVSSHLNACLNVADVSVFDVKVEADEDTSTLLADKPEGQQPGKRGKGKGKGKGKDKGNAQLSATQATKSKGPPLVSVAAIVGGMSAQKQRRILDRGVDILVATPGRLWDILQEVGLLNLIFLNHLSDLRPISLQ